jgi:hypothetical protein
MRSPKKAIQDLLDELEASKQSRLRALERSPKTPLGSFRAGEHCNSATGPEDIRRVPAPSFRQAFVKRRCLIPSDGFYEWKKVPGGKIPHSISMKDDSPFV